MFAQLQSTYLDRLFTPVVCNTVAKVDAADHFAATVRRMVVTGGRRRSVQVSQAERRLNAYGAQRESQVRLVGSEFKQLPELETNDHS